MDILYLIGLNSFSKFGHKRLTLIKNHFKTWEAGFKSGIKEMISIGIPEAVATEFSAVRNKINIQALKRQMEFENIGVVEFGSPNYSRLLSQIYDPPPLLFYKGDISLLNSMCLAIVGTRKCSNYGQQVAWQMSSDLVKQGFCVVSGLALGIDSVAHNACLDSNGQTIAVLGSGIDNKSVYPASNRYLAEKICNHKGLLISEFPLGTSPLKYNFPLRNRIIAGLSLGTIVIEAAIRSGALITARCAMEHNREVFAVPGGIFSPVSAGPNHLLKQGAALVTSFEDILEALDLKRLSSYINNDKIKAESPEEEMVITHLSHEPKHIDELKRLTGFQSPILSSTLTLMEMRGIIKNLGGMRYVLS